MNVVITCSRCKESKLLDEFYCDSTKKSGRSSRCKNCQKKYSHFHYIKNKSDYRERARQYRIRCLEQNRKLIFDYLQTHPCVDCGESDVLVLDFDHIRGKKKFKISWISSSTSMMNLDRIQNEINKCDIRCSNCHRIRTAKVNGHWKLDFIK